MTETVQMKHCLELGMSPETAEICMANAVSASEAVEAYQLLEADPERFFARLAQEKPQRILALYVQLAQIVRPAYQHMHIQETVFLDTFSDIARWEQAYFQKTGQHGLDEYRWLAHHVRMELFHLGSLQFQPQKGPLEVVWQAVPIKTDDLVLHVHIPQGTNLSDIAVTGSYQSALRFWQREEAVLLCDSWLLGPEVQELLAAGSRIRGFAAGYTRICADRSSRQAEERIFGTICDNPQAYPRSGTSLQKAARAYLLKGGKLSAGYGWQRITRR